MSDEQRPEMDDAAPILGRWRNLYIAELAILAGFILIFWRLSAAYA